MVVLSDTTEKGGTPCDCHQSVLPTLRQTKKPQQKFVAHLLGLLLMLPGHATFRNQLSISNREILGVKR